MALWDKLFGAKGPAFGSLGRTVAEAEASGFFTWFHLTPAEDTGETGVARFRPSSEELGSLVAVDLVLSNDRIDEVRLLIRRSFIDDPRQFAFAADITKSFLLAALDAHPEIETAARSIMNYRPAQTTTTVLRREWAEPMVRPEPGAHAVYAGHMAETALRSRRLNARLHNSDPFLLIDIRPN